MREKDLLFDRKKHLLYSKQAKKCIREKLRADYGAERGEALWEETQRRFVESLKDAPDVGGKRSPHHGTYDSILVFAYYTVVPDKPDLAELHALNDELFMSSFKTLGNLFDLTKSAHFRLAAKIFQNVGDRDRALACPAGFQMENKPFDRENGVIFYRFTHCPNATFAAEHGLTHIMPALCNCDYVGLSEIGAALIRRDTLARGCECDYTIVGSESPLAKEHPRTTDERGFWVNE